jgi:hypothetical protein
MIHGNPGDIIIVVECHDAQSFVSECNQIDLFELPDGKYVLEALHVDMYIWRAVFVKRAADWS